MALHISSSKKFIYGTTEILPSHNDCGGFWIIFARKISFHNSDVWRENLPSSYYIHKQTKQGHPTGGNGEKENNRANQSKVQTTKPRAEQRQPIQAQPSNQNRHIFTTHLGIISGNNKEKKKKKKRQNRSVCTASYPQIPNSETRKRSEGSDF